MENVKAILSQVEKKKAKKERKFVKKNIEKNFLLYSYSYMMKCILKDEAENPLLR